MQWTCVERSGVETWKGHCVLFLKKLTLLLLSQCFPPPRRFNWYLQSYQSFLDQSYEQQSDAKPKSISLDTQLKLFQSNCYHEFLHKIGKIILHFALKMATYDTVYVLKLTCFVISCFAMCSYYRHDSWMEEEAHCQAGGAR